MGLKAQVIHTEMSRSPSWKLSVPAVVVPPGPLMFIQGQAALGTEWSDPISPEEGFTTTPDVVTVGETVAEQSEQIFKNLIAILGEVGADLSNIVHMIIFLTDMERFLDFFEVRKRYYPDGVYPPATGVEVNRLADHRLLIEVHATAALGT